MGVRIYSHTSSSSPASVVWLEFRDATLAGGFRAPALGLRLLTQQNAYPKAQNSPKAFHRLVFAPRSLIS